MKEKDKDFVSLLLKSEWLFNFINLLLASEVIWFYYKNKESLIDHLLSVHLGDFTQMVTVEILIVFLIAAILIRILKFIFPLLMLTIAPKIFSVKVENNSEDCLSDRDIQLYLILKDNDFLSNFYKKEKQIREDARSMSSSLIILLFLLFVVHYMSAFVDKLISGNEMVYFFSIITAVTIFWLIKYYTTLELGYYVGYKMANHIKAEIRDMVKSASESEKIALNESMPAGNFFKTKVDE
ncbi:MAG: hypothetical protein M0Z61_07050 [Nitrospiraceae bacterium]|nr:hypothetical protein [Nitrospiraceae bacterium]